MMMFAYSPHGALVGIEYWWNKDISRFKRSGEDSEERKSKEEIDEGRDDRELHDESDGCIAKKCRVDQKGDVDKKRDDR